MQITVQAINVHVLAQTHIKVLLRIDMRHPINVFRLVDIQITLFPDLRESLYAYRVFSSCRAHDDSLFIPVESKDKKTF